jgi:type IV secretory pathway TrbD component
MIHLPGLLLLVALFGGIPFGFGLGLFFVGKRLLHKASRPDNTDTFP